jgi:hypothetical protein
MRIYKLEEWASLPMLPEIRQWTPEEEAEALRLVKESYTEEDLKRFAEIPTEEGVDMGEFLDELEKRAGK